MLKIILIILLLALLAAAAVFLAYILVKLLIYVLREWLAAFVQAVLTVMILLAVAGIAIIVAVVAVDRFGLPNTLGAALILGALGWVVYRLRKWSRGKSSNPAARERKREGREKDSSDGK